MTQGIEKPHVGESAQWLTKTLGKELNRIALIQNRDKNDKKLQ